MMLIQALKYQEPSVSAWQPIETAPKDGTPLLLWDDFAQLKAHTNDPRWGSEALDYGFPPAVPFVGFWDGEHWQLAHYDAYSYGPTHWMPLPDVPGTA
jgi:hypothetical protein